MEALIHSNKHSVVYGRKTIDFSLLYSDRKTMEIAVHPDSTVIVKAPVQSDITLIDHNHSPDFYKLLDSVIPGWEKIKHKLEVSMS